MCTHLISTKCVAFPEPNKRRQQTTESWQLAAGNSSSSSSSSKSSICGFEILHYLMRISLAKSFCEFAFEWLVERASNAMHAWNVAAAAGCILCWPTNLHLATAAAGSSIYAADKLLWLLLPSLRMNSTMHLPQSKVPLIYLQLFIKRTCK